MLDSIFSNTGRSVQVRTTRPMARYELKPDSVKYHPAWVPCDRQSRVPGVVHTMGRKELGRENGKEKKGAQGF